MPIEKPNLFCRGAVNYFPIFFKPIKQLLDSCLTEAGFQNHYGNGKLINAALVCLAICEQVKVKEFFFCVNCKMKSSCQKVVWICLYIAILEFPFEIF